jgi:tryptophan halogenase
MSQMIRRVLVLGGGSAGFLAAIAVKQRLPELDVLVLRSKDIGIIGVGEGTTVSVPNYLHGYFKIDPGEFHRQVHPTYKLGIRFLWGPRPYFNYTFSPQFNMHYKALPRCNGYYCDADDGLEFVSTNSSLMTLGKAFRRDVNGNPIIRNDVAYHMENADFASFLETKARQIGITIIDDTVAHVEQHEQGVAALVCESGRREAADFFIDCSGFYSLLLGKTLAEPFVTFGASLFCDRAMTGGWSRGPDEPILPYTTAQTMDCGWCWQIEHDNRINRGYVYCSSFISDSDADAEFRRKNPKVDATRIVKFVSGHYRRGWVNNVVAIGNAGGFVEPLESTSLGIICEQCSAVAESLADCNRQPNTALAAAFNIRHAQSWDHIRRFLAIHYKFNRRLDTPFWRECLERADISGVEEYLDYFTQNGPSVIWRDTLIVGRDVFGFEGHLTMLIGMKVPNRAPHVPTEHERVQWKAIQQANRAEAAKGLTVKETVEMVRSPKWRYRADFYRID